MPVLAAVAAAAAAPAATTGCAGDRLVNLGAAIETAAPTHAVMQARRRAHRRQAHVCHAASSSARESGRQTYATGC